MNPISRRNTLRVAGGTIATAGIAGGTLLGPGALTTSAVPGPKRVRARLNGTTFSPGQRMVLRISEDLRPGRKIRVVDSTGTKWRRISKTNHKQVWVAHSGPSGVSGRVQVRVLWPDGRAVVNQRHRDEVVYRVVPGTGVPLADGPLIGMSAPADLWDVRASEVGVGVAARRIFADLASGATSQIRTIERAHADGMLPVVSYKVGGDIDGAVSGKFNAVAEQAATRLASYGLPTAVTFWHEPNPDVSGAQYVAASKPLCRSSSGGAAGRSAAERLVAGQPDGDLVGLLPRRAPRSLGLGGSRHLRERDSRAAGRDQARRPDPCAGGVPGVPRVRPADGGG